MLAGLVGTCVAAGLLLRGAWDGWAQTAVILLLVGGASAWLVARIAVGWSPRPDPEVLAWSTALVVLSAAAAWRSPVPAYSWPAWSASSAGLLLFPLVSMVDDEGRRGVERLMRWAAWALVLLAFYQKLHVYDRPPATLLNQNVFAGAILLLLPFASRGRDPFLVVGLLVCLWMTKSVGAWLGLAVAVLAHRRAVGPFAFWVGAAAGFVGLVAAYGKLQSPEYLHRVEWWAAAWRMAAAKPWLGLGPGAFAYALPAYAADKPELSTLFAHQHWLELAAERGWAYALLWSAGLLALLKPAPAGRRFGPVAALAHGLVDYPLSVPGVFWLFCMSCALASPPSGLSANVPSRRRPALLLAAAALAALALRAQWRIWTADRLRATAAAMSVSDPAEAERRLAESETLVEHPESARLRAEVALVTAGEPPARSALETAAAHLERAARLDPYRASNRSLLAGVRARLAASR